MANEFNKYNVLVVESVDNMRATIARMLLQMGFKNVYQAKDGVEAISYLGSHHIDLVVSELTLTRLDGLTLLSHIQADLDVRPIPFVIISSIVEHSLVKQAIEAGISQYIVKPFTFLIFKERISRALNQPFAIHRQPSAVNAVANVSDNQPEAFSILVVDDDAVVRQSLNDLLRPNYQVTLARSGVEAFSICQRDPVPDLILLDIVMPELDGISLLTKLKDHPETSHIDVIFLSGEDSTHSIVKGFELGAVDYLVKPILPLELAVRVKNHVENIQARRQANQQIDQIYQTIKMKRDYAELLQNHLKNQLTLIAESATMIKKNVHHKTQVETISSIIADGSKRMKQLIDVILTLHTVEDDIYPCKPQKFNIVELIEEVMRVNLVSLNQRNLETLQVFDDTDIKVFAELDLSRSMFNVMFQYFIHTSPRGAAVKVIIQRTDDAVVCMFANNSAILESECRLAFERNTTESAIGNVRYGLYLASKIAEIQQLSIHLQSDSIEGTRLWVSMPTS
ncbi:ATP-binding response regulator [Shewanella aestuarii]|uniref:Response regulator n=1 Tax=Shewanella aestuarii TaxID=1028752 RepID=A0A6G9QM46_9GAMM|nr:response regulator [Shewanella aestuarii]QIR15660.1 response regulator [Shewanella aestuarii]